jgi:hypothetical protein
MVCLQEPRQASAKSAAACCNGTDVWSYILLVGNTLQKGNASRNALHYQCGVMFSAEETISVQTIFALMRSRMA